MVYGQNGSGKKWHGQNGTDQMVRITYFDKVINQPSSHLQYEFLFSFPLRAYHLFVTFGY